MILRRQLVKRLQVLGVLLPGPCRCGDGAAGMRSRDRRRKALASGTDSSPRLALCASQLYITRGAVVDFLLSISSISASLPQTWSLRYWLISLCSSEEKCYSFSLLSPPHSVQSARPPAGDAWAFVCLSGTQGARVTGDLCLPKSTSSCL